jgi:hypothetical protein
MPRKKLFVTNLELRRFPAAGSPVFTATARRMRWPSAGRGHPARMAYASHEVSLAVDNFPTIDCAASMVNQRKTA